MFNLNILVQSLRILQSLPQNDLLLTPKAAKEAELSGYDMIMTMENRHEPFLALGVAAVNTKSITLGTAVAIAFARSPMVVANVSWDLQNASRGRFVLGLGPQIKPHNERRFSVPWSAPVPRLREYVDSLRAIWLSWETGQGLEYRGEHYHFTLMPQNFVPESTKQSPIPITIAAVGEKSLHLAGESCDGVRLHPFCTRSYAQNVALPIIQKALLKSPRSREQFEITGGGFIATGIDDEEVEKSLEWIRARIAFYGSTPAYWPVLRHHGLEDLGLKLNKMTKSGQWSLMANEISDDVLELFTAIGKYSEITNAISYRFEGVADAIYATTSTDIQSKMPRDLIDDIKRIPIKFIKFSEKW
ncbi:MAG: LLM class F420-dependent oxidoreductase [Alphaproteobacteria bacterium]|nr:LLM class F420-dependent oxidoreductase [Alphaproteobacteria bacterium]